MDGWGGGGGRGGGVRQKKPFFECLTMIIEKGVDGVGENNRNIIAKENKSIVRFIVVLAQGEETR